jgi:hypothetical protein
VWLLLPSTPLESPYIVFGWPLVSSLPIARPHPFLSISSLPFARPHSSPSLLSSNPSTFMPYCLPYLTPLTLTMRGTVLYAQYMSVRLVVLLWASVKQLNLGDLVLIPAHASLAWGTQLHLEIYSKLYALILSLTSKKWWPLLP